MIREQFRSHFSSVAFAMLQKKKGSPKVSSIEAELGDLDIKVVCRKTQIGAAERSWFTVRNMDHELTRDSPYRSVHVCKEKESSISHKSR